MGQHKLAKKPMRVTHQFGTNGTHVIQILSARVRELVYTPEEAEATIKAFQACLEQIRRYQISQGKAELNG